MKRSNIILIVIGIAALGWMVVFQWMAARAVIDFSEGRLSRYGEFSAGSHYRPDIITQPLPAFSEIEIRGIGKVEVILERGTAFALRRDTLLSGRVKHLMENDRLVLELTGISDEAASSYTISAPLLNGITLYHLENTLIKGFTMKSLTVKIQDVQPLLFTQCAFGSLFVESSDKLQTQYLDIDNTNQIKQLAITLYGKGTVRLGAAGTMENTIVIPDSMDIQASSNILKQLKLTGLQ